MLPHAIAAANVYLETEVLETRIVELNMESFTCRMASKLAVKQVSVEVILYIASENGYWKKKYDSLSISEEKEGNVGIEYTFEIDDEIYREKVASVWKSYEQYVQLKTEKSDGELSEVLLQYPSQKDAVFSTSFRKQQLEWYEKAMQETNGVKYPQNPPKSSALRAENCQLTLELDENHHYQDFLSRPAEDFKCHYFQQKELENHPLANKEMKRIYIGNAFCPILFPEKQLLWMLLEKAKGEQLCVTLVFSYLRPSQICEMENLLQELAIWCHHHRLQMELEINDWGMLELIKEYKEVFTPILGRLLNKRHKDPRESYLSQRIPEKATIADFYRNHLDKKYGIKRLEWELTECIPIDLKGQNTLHLPYYQTNTSQYCPIYAVCQEGDRGRQREPKDCPHYCEKYVFLYPKHLHMIGKYNSLFGYAAKGLEDMEYLEQLLLSGYDRVVINLF